MTEPTLTRQTFLLQLSCGLAAFAVGCDSDDSGGDGTDTDATTDPTGSTDPGTMTTDPGTTSSSGTTDPTDATTSPDASSSSSGGADTGSSSGSGSGSSSGSSSGGEASVCLEGIVAAVISNNHGHVLEIPLADIDAGVETSYDASGAAGHCHEVVLTAEDFAALRAGDTVVKFSCNGGDHEYVLSCSEGARPPGDPDRACQDDPGFGSC